MDYCKIIITQLICIENNIVRELKFRYHLWLITCTLFLLTQCKSVKDSRVLTPTPYKKNDLQRQIFAGSPPVKESKISIQTWCFSDSTLIQEIEINTGCKDTMLLAQRIAKEFVNQECIKEQKDFKNYFIRISKSEYGIFENIYFLKGGCNQEVKTQLLKIFRRYPIQLKDKNVSYFYIRLRFTVYED